MKPKSNIGALWRSLILMLGGATALFAQAVTGSITGSIADATGAMVPGANITLRQEETGATRTAVGDGQGSFVFNALPPGEYTISIQHEGFKRYESRHLMLPANERLSTGVIQLEVGTIAETVSVTAQGAMVQAASAERAGLVSSSQMENLTVINRNYAVLVSLLPGVVANTGGENIGYGSDVTMNVQGNRSTGNNVSIDGMPITDLGAGSGSADFISMDAVREVKMLVSNYQAEFGRKPGANVQVVTKSGTQEFHGAAYWYKRHEEFNATDFFNNRNGIAQPPYRYTTAGANLGGPLYIPGKFNRNRDKLFFFFSEEQLREQRPQPIRQVTMPTALERQGDFSASRDLNGALIPVRDPAAGNLPFAGNRIPASRINALGQGYLNLFPLPNFFNTAISAGRYNYQVQESLDAPKHNEVLRVDYNVNSKLSMYGRYGNWWEDITGFAVPGGNSNWGWLPAGYTNTSHSGVISATYIISPTAILEASTGVVPYRANGAALSQADLDRVNRVKSGVTVPQFHPEFNPMNLVPAATFSGITNPANVSYDNRFPLRGGSTLFTWSGTLTKTQAGHTFKAGLWAERARDFKGVDGTFTGNFDFGRNVNNPNDTNHPYGNALLGNFASYTESTARPWVQGRSTLLEWFAQDNWKVSRKLTLDLGVRFSWAQPYHSYRREEAGFIPDRWNAANQVSLIQPAIVDRVRVGRNPVTGEILPAVMIGAIAPGAGDPLNGMVNLLTDLSYPPGLRENSGLKTAPRIGFAYDPFGKGKTAIRGGAGLFYETREMGSRQFGAWSNPPMRFDPVIYYGNLGTFINSSGVNFPSATSGFTREWPVARVMTASLGIQQNIGFGTVIDVAYSGSFGRHLQESRNINAIPFGANFAAANADPTTPGKPLPAAFLRPYAGYNNINIYDYGSNSSYHSLQVTANRRFARGFQYGFSWTWSKAMDYVDANTNAISTLINPKVWNYGKAGFDRTHVAKLNWIWDLPRASRAWNNFLMKAVLDDWQLSGIATFSSGAPSGIGLSFVSSVDVTGSPTDGARVMVVQNPILPAGDRTFSRNFNTSAFAAPKVGAFGNAPKDVIRGPGPNNWDMSLLKRIPLRGERFKLQFRSEFYNAFNHTQFTALDTGARFDAQGNQVNARFGEFTAADSARHIQFALRLTF